VEKLTCRLLPWAALDGPTNMASDEAMLERAVLGEASLRFYGWSEPTISLGYFQSASARLYDDLWSGLPYVRRPTGGYTLVHHYELTYALALPAGVWRTTMPCLPRTHQLIAKALVRFGVDAALQGPATRPPAAGPLCFQHVTTGDLLVDECKVAGSAQRRRRGALLQHGGVVLVQSPFTPNLPGILDLTGTAISPADLEDALTLEFRRATNAELIERPLSPQEIADIRRVAHAKYSSAAWNAKR
jgi:lipoyl(octanoyl) transferase